MKKLILLLAITCLSQSLKSQSPYNGFQRAAYNEAILDFYEKDYLRAHAIFKHLYLIDKSYGEINYYLGASLLNIRGKEDSAFFHLQIAFQDSVKEATFWLGQAYHIRYDFESALKNYNLYLSYPNHEIPSSEVNHHIAISKRAAEMILNPIDLQIENLGPGINSKYHEYGPVLTSDQSELYYTSRRQIDESADSTLDENYFEDIYYAESKDGNWNTSENAGPPLNTKTHDATVSLTSSGNELIIYRTNKNLYGGDLYLAEREKGGWTKPVPLSDNINSRYQEASAMISPSGQELYFSSNRPGGMGGKDLYRAKKLPNGEWSLPENLGAEINTPYDEDSPFLHTDGYTLYFASNGHETMGGFDIFKSKLRENGIWTRPENIGYPLNTVKDDIYFMMCPDCQTGYYSADLKGGYGLHDLYRVYFPSTERNIVVVKGVISDAQTKQPIRAQINLAELKRPDRIKSFQSNANSGKFIMILDPDIDYSISIVSDNYQIIESDLIVHDNYEESLQEVEINYELTPDP